MVDLEKSLLARYREWMSAAFEGDRTWQERIEHEEAIFTYPGGVRYGREEHIALMSHAVDVREHDITSFQCRGLGEDIAVAWFDHTLRTGLSGNPFGDPELKRRFAEGIAFAVTTVWQRFAGGWRVMSQDANILDDGYVARDKRDAPNVITYP